MRVKHILVTSLNRWFKPGTDFDKALDNDWLFARWEIFTKYTLPSVASQTNLDFDWIILCHEQSPTWLKERAKTINLPCRVHFSFLQNDPEINGLKAKSWDTILTTRIDSDDAWHRTAMARIRESFEENPYGYEILNFDIGYWYDTFNKRLALVMKPSPPFNTKIHFAPIRHPLYTGGNHTTLKERYQYRDISHGDPLFLRLLHNTNISSRINHQMSFFPYSISQRILQDAFNISDLIDGLDTVHTPNLKRSNATNNPRIQFVLANVLKESNTLRLLEKNRKTFQLRFKLTEEEIRMLQSADLLSAVGID